MASILSGPDCLRRREHLSQPRLEWHRPRTPCSTFPHPRDRRFCHTPAHRPLLLGPTPEFFYRLAPNLSLRPRTSLARTPLEHRGGKDHRFAVFPGHQCSHPSGVPIAPARIPSKTGSVNCRCDRMLPGISPTTESLDVDLANECLNIFSTR